MDAEEKKIWHQAGTATLAFHKFASENGMPPRCAALGALLLGARLTKQYCDPADGEKTARAAFLNQCAHIWDAGLSDISDNDLARIMLGGLD